MVVDCGYCLSDPHFGRDSGAGSIRISPFEGRQMNRSRQEQKYADPEAGEKFEQLFIRLRLNPERVSGLSQDEKQAILNQHLWKRQSIAESKIVPWVERVAALGSAKVLEIGCGTGSTTAAFAGRSSHVTAVDIDASSIEVAELRLRAFGLDNVTLQLTNGSDLEAGSGLPGNAAAYDVALLYAVLEHQTLEERKATLRNVWQALRPGGVLVVCETPNRLAWFDYHTSMLPFYHSLPMEYKIKWALQSPKHLYRNEISRKLGGSRADVELAVARSGTGVSFHEFEEAIGPDFSETIVCDGFEREIASVYPLRLEDIMLAEYFVKKPIGKSIAFARQPLNLVSRKPDGSPIIKPQHTEEEILWLSRRYEIGDCLVEYLRG